MMNASVRVIRRAQVTVPLPARTVAAVVATVTLAVLAVACGGRPPSAGAPSARSRPGSPSAVTYSSCMRSHGVPEFPDPPSGGGVPKGSAQEFGVSNSEYQAATRACQPLYPATNASIQECETTGNCPEAVVQQALNLMRRYARCLRAHGVPNWPDPTIGPQGQPFFHVSSVGISYQYTHSVLFESKDRVCERLVGGSAGVPVPLG